MQLYEAQNCYAKDVQALGGVLLEKIHRQLGTSLLCLFSYPLCYAAVLINLTHYAYMYLTFNMHQVHNKLAINIHSFLLCWRYG